MRRQAREPLSLTKTFIASLAPSAQAEIYWDREVRGLGVRVMPSGTKSFVMKYRLGKGRAGPQRFPTLGKVGEITLDQARDTARKWKALAREGVDPNRERHAEATAPTFKDLCDEYLKRHAARKRSGSEDRRKIEKRLRPKLGHLRVKDVRFEDIEAIHRNMSGSPIEANRVVALLSKMFNLAIRWGWRDDNPTSGIERYPERKRARYLSADEIHALSGAMEQYVRDAKYTVYAQRAVDAIRLLALTGARRGEVLSAQWSQFDLKRGIWTKPDAATKQKREHRVPLSEAAIGLLNDMRSRRSNSDAEFLFPGKDGGHLVELKRPWLAICKLAGLTTKVRKQRDGKVVTLIKPAVRLHDLRHTYASILVSGGLSLPMIGALLGHTQPQTTARYAHLMDDPLRDAANLVGNAFVRRTGPALASKEPN